MPRSSARQQLISAGRARHACVVARCDALGAERVGGVEEMPELDLAVAQHVGIGRAAGRIFGEEVREDAFPVFAGEIAEVDRQAEPAADGDRVAAVVLGAAVAAAVVGPVLHEQAGDRFAGIAQQQGRDRRIHAAGHAHDGPRRRAGRRIDVRSVHALMPSRHLLQQRQRVAAAGQVIGDDLPDQRAAVAVARLASVRQASSTARAGCLRPGRAQDRGAAVRRRRRSAGNGDRSRGAFHWYAPTKAVSFTSQPVSSRVSRRAASSRLSSGSRWPAGWLMTSMAVDAFLDA